MAEEQGGGQRKRGRHAERKKLPINTVHALSVFESCEALRRAQKALKRCSGGSEQNVSKKCPHGMEYVVLGANASDAQCDTIGDVFGHVRWVKGGGEQVREDTEVARR